VLEVNKLFTNGLLLLCAAFLLTGCGSNRHIRDLKQYVDTLQKSASNAPAHAAPHYAAPSPVTFVTNSGRSPFEEHADAIKTASSAETLMHPLQGYALSGLKFKGTVTQGAETFAFILAPDDKLYQVKLGDIIGDHYGKIVNIYPDHLEVQEKVSDRTNQTTTRIVTLQRKD
jgi:type IV pilus assembly protein PilP